MEFKIRDDFILRSVDHRKYDTIKRLRLLVDYNTDQLSQAVSYFLNIINKIDTSEKPIGINYADLSFLTIAFSLAIIKSKKDYVLVVDPVLENTDDLNLFSFFFIAGSRTIEEHYNISKLINQCPDRRMDMDTYSIMNEVESWQGREELTFEFGKNTKTYILPFNTKKPFLLTTSGIMDESSIKAAMDNYIYEDDYCVLKRSFNHVGVHTLIIFPSLFKAKSIAVVDHYRTIWDMACENATHIHISRQMIQDKFTLPKNLRTLSTGGYHFDKDCLDYVYAQSNIERIVDCYGTGHCPPPMAIRELTKENSFGLQPFKWVNKVFYPNISLDGQGHVKIRPSVPYPVDGLANSSAEGDLLIADIIEHIGEDTFYLYGSKENYIRVLDTRITVKELTEMLNKIIDDIRIEFVNKDGTNVPKLITDISNKEKLDSFVLNNKVEADVEYTNDR